MPRPSTHDYPAQLWYEAQSVFGGFRAKNSLYNKHEAHVKEYMRNPLGRALRRYQPKHDHEQHVMARRSLIKATLSRNTEYVYGPVAGSKCVVWVGHITKCHTIPYFRIYNRHNGAKINGAAAWQEIHEGRYLTHGNRWGIGECGRSDCLRHRKEMTKSEHNSWAKKNSPNYKAQVLALMRNSGNKPLLSSEQIDEVKRLYAQQVSVAQLAKQYSVSQSCIYDVIKERRRKIDFGYVDPPKCGISFITQQLLAAA